MGRKYSPAYADIYMAEWERTALIKCQVRPLLYLRYLDDIFGIWSDTVETFQDFLNTLNNHHPNIKIKHNIQPQEVEFLDTTVFFHNCTQETKQLATKVFFKETDRHTLLHKNSYHPKHTFRGIIKSQIIRFQRICTYREHVDEAAGILFRALKPRGYSSRFLRRIKMEVLRSSGGPQSDPPNIGSPPLVPFITTFHRQLHLFNRRLRSNFTQLQEVCEPLQNFKMITAYRRNRNLRDILVHSQFKALNRARMPTDARKAPPYLHNAHTGEGLPTKTNWSTTEANLIYVIECGHCNKLYIGETGNTIRVRMTQHYYLIRTKKGVSLLHKHFQEVGAHFINYRVVEQNHNWSTAQRRHQERTWIQRLRTISPLGLNEKNILPGASL
ncbi:unnamed protein product [Ophioblennius macclurei]